MIKHQYWKQYGFISAYIFHVAVYHQRSQGQELKHGRNPETEADAEAMMECWLQERVLASCDLHPLFSYKPWPTSPVGGYCSQWDGHSTSTINQENTPQTCARSIRWGHFSTKIPSSKTTPVAVSWYKTSQKMLHYLGLLHRSYKWQSQVLRLTLSGFLLSPLLQLFRCVGSKAAGHGRL